MKNNIKQSLVLKTLCFICIPILVIAIISSIIYTVWLAENEDMKTAETIEQTNLFADSYISSIYNTISRINKSPNYYFTEYYDSVYLADSYYRYSDMLKYLIVDNELNRVYTNVGIWYESEYSSTNSSLEMHQIEAIKNELENDNGLYCNYANNTVDTNINNEKIQNLNMTYLKNTLEKNPSFEIYTVVNTNPSFTNEFFTQKLLFDSSKNLGDIPIILVPFMIILAITMAVYLLYALGHKKNVEGIYLNRFDKWPIEISGLLIFTSIVLLIVLINETSGVGYNETASLILTIITSSLFAIVYALIMCIFATIVKKIKSHTLWNSSLIYRFFKWLKNIIQSILSDLNTNAKIIAVFLGIILISLILASMNILLLLIFWIFVLYMIIKKTNELIKIRDALKDIYNGQTDKRLNVDEFKGELKEVATYINDIQNGFSNAVNESIKSERMKTELITNVSHDIKTPLTSIINYVDLLKAEEIESEKAKEYIGILDSKSQRLKKLIEDLVEASKASSGNLKLNMERINLVELIKQTTGEFEDKFNEKNLKVEINTSEENIYIEADNRYMYRVIENLFSNISKYALEGSRVYIDVTKKENEAKIEIKNISKDKLNITAEELMQRFVRGDKSRTTEGSGLGLSISKSLTELQHGTFNIIIDGDLFKVEIVF